MEDRRVGSGSSQPEGVESEEQHEVEMTDAEEVENGVKGMEVDMDDLPTMPPVRRGEEVPGLKERLKVIEGELSRVVVRLGLVCGVPSSLTSFHARRHRASLSS